MTQNPPAGTPAAVLKARLVRLARDPRALLIPEARAIAAELSDVLAQIDDLDRRQAETERQWSTAVAELGRLTRLVELGSTDPGPCG